MTEKQALIIAYNILNDELDRCKKDDLGPDDNYYIEIKTAMEKIHEMIKAR